jgi:raffinose/stachyose/melibiose transport system substrate-binding protein
MRSRNWIVFFGTLIVVLSMLLTSCSTPTPTQAPATAATAQPAEKAKFEVWTSFVQGGDEARYIAMEKVIAEFNKQNPDIEVKQQVFVATEFKKSVQLAVESGQAGCMITADIYSANLLPWYYGDNLVVLDDYAKQYGWLDKDKGGAIASANQGTRASKVYDGPEIAGLPWLYQPLGIFYNQKLFDENSINLPTTWDELIAAMDAFVAKGITPMAFGNAGQFHGLHILSSLVAANVPIDRLDKWFAGDPSIKFTDPDFMWANQTGRDWAEKGYFPKDFNSIVYDDQIGAFTAGQIPMFITGSWNVARFAESESGANIHYLPFPMHNTSSPAAIVKTPDWPLVMTQTCPYKDQAAKFMDFMTSEFTSNAFYEAGVIPTWPFDPSKTNGTPLAAELMAGIANLKTGYYIDTVDPEVHSVMWPTSQNLFDGTITPEAFAEGMQAARDKYLATAPK